METANYAFIKGDQVVNIVVFEYPIDENLKTSMIQEFELDQIILSANNCAVGGTYDGEKFWIPQPFPSWTKNEELNEWDAPVPYPTFDEENPKYYTWNEDILNWEEIQVSD